MVVQRTDRLNSLLKEVISEVIKKEVKHTDVSEFITITQVDITKDLHLAKVYFSVIGSDEDKKKTLNALNSAAGFIAARSSKKVRMRYFPSLTFYMDESVDKHIRIQEMLKKINEEKEKREGLAQEDE